MSRKIGAQKQSAKASGVSYEIYLANRKSGLKWCWKCKSWKLEIQFSKDHSRGDGLKSICRECGRVKQRVKRLGFVASEKQKQKARDAVRWAIKRGRLIKAIACPCFYCGKQAHQYHHYRGYGDSNLLDIRATCQKCHINQHWDN